MPMSLLLSRRDATVTLAHSKTPPKQLEELLAAADIVVVAVGRPGFLKGEWLKPGSVVIDVGINPIPDSTKQSGRRLVGDCDFESCEQTARLITPVPGGVGPMTIAMLLQNTLIAAIRATSDVETQQNSR
uniref:methenyltetrahydrofolate cyclohydrolase n=1 Tax=Pinguiococcus pyrenoidosus TaxID=172671 RepID=A0A7R9YDT1_9STRA